MTNHPANLVFRFILELLMWAALAVVGWNLAEGPMQWVLAMGLPLASMVLWGVFRVPNDGGPPVVQVSGVVRLALELASFATAIVGLYIVAKPLWATLLATLVAVHYALSMDRVRWLLRGAEGDY